MLNRRQLRKWHLVHVHVEVVQAVLVDVVGGEGPAVLPLHPELLRRSVEAEEDVHGGDSWTRDIRLLILSAGDLSPGLSSLQI